MIKKLPFRHRLADGSIHIGFDEGEIGGAAFLLGPPFPVVLGFSPLGIFNDGQPIFPAQSVRFSLHIEIILVRAMVFDSIYKGNRIENEMVVQMIFSVQMGSHQHLVFFTPQLFCQGKADLMGQLRRDLAGGKALIAVVGHSPVLLSKPLFYRYHPIAGSRGAAIHPGNKLPQDRFAFAFHRLACFVPLNGILDYIRKALSLLAVHILLFKEIRVFGLVWIFNINENLAQPAVHPPDRRGSQSYSIARGRITALVMSRTSWSNFRISSS